MENKGRKVDLNMWGYVRSLTDPIEEHKEIMNLDLETLTKSLSWQKLL